MYRPLKLAALLLTVVPSAIGICSVTPPSLVVVETEKYIAVRKGDVLELHGVASSDRVRAVYLLVDRREHESKAEGGTYCFRWRTERAELGTHNLDIVLLRVDGGKEFVHRARVHVVRDSPINISAAPVARLGTPLTVTIGSTCDIRPTYATLIVDAVPARHEQQLVNGGVVWDFIDAEPGEHILRAKVRDNEGNTAYSTEIAVRVPERLVVEAPRAVKITEQSTQIELKVTLADGLRVKRLAALCDERLVAELTERADRLAWSALELESGNHTVQVDLQDDTGRIARFGPQTVRVDNVYRREQRDRALAESAALAANERARKAEEAASAEKARAEEEGRRQSELKRLETKALINAALLADASRNQILQRAYGRSPLTKSTGSIGVVRGMSVVCVGAIFEYGSLNTVSARAGVGKGRLLTTAGSTDASFRRSMHDARAFAAAYAASAGLRLDWQRIDVTFDLGDGDKAGDSAGAAMATALVSTLLKIPVRNNTVVTGAITASGVVRPVGGVDLKAAAALQDPSVLTVIVPRFAGNVADVLDLPYPLLAGHRIIAASDMRQVLRQALQGYDQGTMAAASELFGMGLKLYGRGDTKGAVHMLRQAQSCTPEDLTIPLWIRVLQDPSR